MDPRALVQFRAAYEALAAQSRVPLTAQQRGVLSYLQRMGRLHVIRLDAAIRTIPITGGGGGQASKLGPPIRMNGLSGWFDSVDSFVTNIESAGAQEFSSIGQGAQDAANWVQSEAASLWNSASAPVENAYHAAVQDVSNTIDQATRSVGGSIQWGFDQIATPVENWTKNATGFLSQLGTQVFGASQNIANASTYIGAGLIALAGVIFLKWVLE